MLVLTIVQISRQLMAGIIKVGKLDVCRRPFLQIQLLLLIVTLTSHILAIAI